MTMGICLYLMANYFSEKAVLKLYYQSVKNFIMTMESVIFYNLKIWSYDGY